MNTSMDGKKVAKLEAIQADGNPYEFRPGVAHHQLGGRTIETLELSATFHGDHDQFWVVASDHQGEIARWNCRSSDTRFVLWEE